MPTFRRLAICLWIGLLFSGCQPAAPVEVVSKTSSPPVPSPTLTIQPANAPTNVPPTAIPQPANTPTAVPPTAVPQPARLFDDFSYPTTAEMSANGWIVRSAPGWPGVPGAIWSPEDVRLVDDSGLEGNRLVQMTSSTQGSSATTRQTQLCHQRKYLYGTYAARVSFSDAPESGPDGDQIVQTFYTISPLTAPMDPDYSEYDFEYLPNGGWGSPELTLFATTWETFSPEPDWRADNASKNIQGSLTGWHTLVVQVTDSAVQYYLDGERFATHSQRFVPETPMSINFNLWFVRDGLVRSAELRQYVEQIDWVYFQEGSPLAPDIVEAEVNELRQSDSPFMDTVPAYEPPLDSPCNF